jgi:hypothetical protein
MRADIVRLIEISFRLLRAMPRNTLVEELRVLIAGLSVVTTPARPCGVHSPPSATSRCTPSW